MVITVIYVFKLFDNGWAYCPKYEREFVFFCLNITDQTKNINTIKTTTRRIEKKKDKPKYWYSKKWTKSWMDMPKKNREKDRQIIVLV